MPELPDVEIYVESLLRVAHGQPIERIRLQSPFLLRTFDPPITTVEGRRLVGASRLGKRIVLEVEGDLFLVLHLMIAGRLRWKKAGQAVPKRNGLAAFDFPSGTLMLTEASGKKRASLHVMRGAAGVAEHDPGGLEVLEADAPVFRETMRRTNHTLKRALTDPRILSGIGNAYSDEILHHARLSPFLQTQKVDDAVLDRLWAATRDVLTTWTERTRREVGDGFPDRVTAFRSGMAVHGRYGQPCPVCATPIQRIVYAANEANYCPTCQTDGRLLADRALSQLLKKDWPRTLEALEAKKRGESSRRIGGRDRL